MRRGEIPGSPRGIDLPGVLRTAEESGLRRALLLGLGLARDLLGAELPEGIGEEIEKDRAVGTLRAHVGPPCSGGRPNRFPGDRMVPVEGERPIRGQGRIRPDPRPDAHRRGLGTVSPPRFLYFLYFLYRPLRLLGLTSPLPAGPQHPLNRDAPANSHRTEQTWGHFRRLTLHP